MKKWKDISSYSQSDKKRVPRTFEIRAADVRVCVTRWIHGDPARWYLLCPEAGYVSHTGLNNQDLEDAKHEALCRVHDVLAKRVEAIEALMEGK